MILSLPSIHYCIFDKMVLLIIAGILLLLYSLLILFFWLQWRKIPVYRRTGPMPGLQVSIIVPARNEETTIGNLLDALLQQDYPSGQLEIIVVDDHSTDQTAAVIARYPTVTLLTLRDDGLNSYKKKALERGIAAAKGTWILTTDADCIPHPTWVSTIISFAQAQQSAFVAAPVAFSFNRSVLQQFQALDFLVLQGITGASAHGGHLSLCNGANLAYTKEAFTAAGGFAGIDQIASGDDLLLMHKIAAIRPGAVHYVKSEAAIVHTLPMQTWKTFFNQRIRWASKALHYKDRRITAVLLLVLLLNLCFPVLLTAYLLYGGSYGWAVLGLFVCKTVVEYPFVYAVARFFQMQRLLAFFVFFQPLHILYTILSGFLGQAGHYEWKGRRVK